MSHKMGLIGINLGTQSAPETAVYDGNSATHLYDFNNVSFKPKQLFEGSYTPYVYTDDMGYFVAKLGTEYTFGTSYKVLNNGSATGAVQQWHVETTTINTSNQYRVPDINLQFKNYARLYKHNGSNYYSGSVQTFTPQMTGKYKMECWGARAGLCGRFATTSYGNVITNTGQGGYTCGIITLTDTPDFYIYTGSMGISFALDLSRYPGTVVDDSNYEVNGAWNGGGAANNQCCWDGNNGIGGGATDIRLVKCSSDTDWSEFVSLKSRIMVAGGAGAVVSNTYTNLGAAGGLESYEAKHVNPVKNGDGVVTRTEYFTAPGATQTTGFKFGLGGSENHYVAADNSDPDNPIARVGGYDRTSGGGGYMGGCVENSWENTTRQDFCAASGGTSYISGHAGCVAILESSTENAEGSQTLNFRDDADAVARSTHFSGRIFENTVMIDGKGYAWTTTKSVLQAMPNPQSSGNLASGVGNGHYGYARITIMPYD